MIREMLLKMRFLARLDCRAHHADPGLDSGLEAESYDDGWDFLPEMTRSRE